MPYFLSRLHLGTIKKETMEKYIEIFNKLWEHSENEVVEFKKAETNFDIDELGKYFSALSNEANLRDHEFAWIVFGVLGQKTSDYRYNIQRW